MKVGSVPLTDDEHHRGFWIALALGGGVLTFGAIGFVRDTPFARVLEVAAWVVGADLLHDFLIAPLILAVVCLCGKVPTSLRTLVRSGVLASLLVIAFGWPGLRGYGVRPDNATIHPLNSTTAVLSSLAIAWSAILVAALCVRIVTKLHQRDV